LNDVSGIFTVVDDAQAAIVQRLVVSPYQDLKGINLAFQASGDAGSVIVF
jgi:hypothetical protein